MVRSGGVTSGKTASRREATPGSLASRTGGGAVASARLLPAPRGRARLVATVVGWGPTRVAAVMILLGLALRALGAYSDITQLYFRDALWQHPLPYVDYPLEYPALLRGII